MATTIEPGLFWLPSVSALRTARRKTPLWERRIARKEPEERKIPNRLYFDCETGTPGDLDTMGGQFVMGCCKCACCGKQRFTTVAALLDIILLKRHRGFQVVAHNGMGYDFTYLLEFIGQHPDYVSGLHAEIVMRSEARPLVIKLKHTKHTIELRDSWHILPVSLEKAAETLAPELPKIQRPWSLPDGSVNWPRPDDEQDWQYLERDVDALQLVVERYDATIYETFGINTKLTATSTARAAWQTTLHDDEVYYRLTPTVEAFCREAAHGGLVFLTTNKRIHSPVTQIDKHAHYADMMIQGVPYGNPTATDTLDWTRPGVYRAIVTVPDSEEYPFLISDKGLARGTFRVTAYSNELQYALSLGYVVTILHGYVFDTIVYPFTTFLRTCERLEMKERGTAVGLGTKIMRNSLSGLFDKSPESLKMAYFADGLPDTLEPLVDYETGELSEHYGFLREPLSAAYMHPEWYGWHTAAGRIEINRWSRLLRAYYGDTDGIVVPADKLHDMIARGLLTLGPYYGQFDIEAEYTWFQAGGPKNYKGALANGKTKSRVKGIPKRYYTESDHERALAGERVTIRVVGIAGAKSVMSGAALQTNGTRSYSQLTNSIAWIADSTGRVQARMYDG